MSLPSVKITCEGRPLPDHIEVLELEIEWLINRVPQATLTLLDGSLPERRFTISDSGLLAPGHKVSIALGYVSDGRLPETVFEGLVVRHAVTATSEGCRLMVQVSDPAIKMTRRRRSAIYYDKRDDEVMRTLIKASGLEGHLEPTPITHPELVQFNVSDWDFLVSRADALGLAIRVSQGRVDVLPLALGSPARVLNHGLDDTRELELTLDGTQQWTSLTVSDWDTHKLRQSQPVKANPKPLRIGNTSDADLARAVEAPEATLFHGAPTAPEELQCWANARLAKLRWSLLRGTATVHGNAKLKPLDTVEIQGVGARFNGEALVSGVTHTVNSNGWSTRLRLGIAAECFARSPDLMDMPASGLLPAAAGLQIATVTALRNDSNGDQRVKVLLPQAVGELWARLLTPDAGHRRGFVFRPEVGDEVVLGFLNDDPRQPLILGALFGSTNLPPEPVRASNEKNNLRAIVSRAGTRIVFDDSAPSLHLETTASGNADGNYKNRISINEKDKIITIEDEHNNKILLSAQGITLESGKDISLSADGKVKIKGGMAVEVEGTFVEVKAKANLDLKGNARTNLGSDGDLGIRGRLVRIN